jgi:AraC-like DNA-binding protein
MVTPRIKLIFRVSTQQLPLTVSVCSNNVKRNMIDDLLTGRVDTASIDRNELELRIREAQSASIADRLRCFLLRAHVLRERSDPTSTLKSLRDIQDDIYAHFHGEIVAVYEELVAYELVKSGKPVHAVLAGTKALAQCEATSGIALRAHRTIATAQLQLGDINDAVMRLNEICMPIAKSMGDLRGVQSINLQIAQCLWIRLVAASPKYQSVWSFLPLQAHAVGAIASLGTKVEHLLASLPPQEFGSDAYFLSRCYRALLISIKDGPAIGLQAFTTLIRECVGANDYLAARLKLEKMMVARWSGDWEVAADLIKELLTKLPHGTTQISTWLTYERAQLARHRGDIVVHGQLWAEVLRCQLSSYDGISQLFVRELPSLRSSSLGESRQARSICEALSNPDSFSDSLERVLSRKGVTRRTAELVLQRDIGRSPADFRLEQRMIFARRLVLDTVSSFDAIAKRVGFSSAGSFATAYRRVHGINPSEDRSRGAL